MRASKRTIAHFILDTLLRKSIEKFGSPFVIDEKGRITVYRNGQTYYFEESQAPLKFFVEESIYSLKQISNAINLLNANKHIEIIGEQGGLGLEYTLIKATPLGIIAYEAKFYKKFNYEFWTLVFVITGTILSTAVGIVTCTRTH